MLVTSRRPHPLLVIGWGGNCHHFHHHHHHHHHCRHHHHHRRHDVEMGGRSMTCKPSLTQSQADSTAELLFGNSHHDDDVCLCGDPCQRAQSQKSDPQIANVHNPGVLNCLQGQPPANAMLYQELTMEWWMLEDV